jgi:hypothetical protein
MGRSSRRKGGHNRTILEAASGNVRPDLPSHVRRGLTKGTGRWTEMSVAASALLFFASASFLSYP